MSNNQGFTLIEIMIALVVSLLLFMGLMQTSLIGIDSNMRNVLRDAAVQIAEDGINQAKMTAYPPVAPAGSVLRDFRNVSSFPYTTSGLVTTLSTCNSRVDVTVTWSWKAQNFSHTSSAVIRNRGDSRC